MSPFGICLEQLRRNRNLQQKDLAELVGINPCYVSVIERGRKGPPSKDVLDKIVKSLNLNQLEKEEFWYNVELSELSFKVPDNVSRSEFELVYKLKKCLGKLSDEQVLIMLTTMKIGNETL
ncbi:helix-turn-helix domain-containing protein [Colwellia sp. E150_009]